jgi:hypothetical protein
MVRVLSFGVGDGEHLPPLRGAASITPEVIGAALGVP